MAALFQVGLDAADKLFVAVVAVAEEDAQRGERLLERNLTVLTMNYALTLRRFGDEPDPSSLSDSPTNTFIACREARS